MKLRPIPLRAIPWLAIVFFVLGATCWLAVSLPADRPLLTTMEGHRG